MVNAGKDYKKTTTHILYYNTEPNVIMMVKEDLIKKIFQTC